MPSGCRLIIIESAPRLAAGPPCTCGALAARNPAVPGQCPARALTASPAAFQTVPHRRSPPYRCLTHLTSRTTCACKTPATGYASYPGNRLEFPSGSPCRIPLVRAARFMFASSLLPPLRVLRVISLPVQAPARAESTPARAGALISARANGNGGREPRRYSVVLEPARAATLRPARAGVIQVSAPASVFLARTGRVAFSAAPIRLTIASTPGWSSTGSQRSHDNWYRSPSRSRQITIGSQPG
jgi:hypothetical protein